MLAVFLTTTKLTTPLAERKTIAGISSTLAEFAGTRIYLGGAVVMAGAVVTTAGGPGFYRFIGRLPGPPTPSSSWPRT